jgi:hypothetical protein
MGMGLGQRRLRRASCQEGDDEQVRDAQGPQVADLGCGADLLVR